MNGVTIVSPRLERAAVAAEALDHAGPRLRDHADRARGDDKHEHDHDGERR